MKRNIDIIRNPKKLNPWVKKSITLFNETAYLDNIHGIYPFQVAPQQRIEGSIRREMIQAHQSRDTERLLNLLMSQTRFPYEEPIWFLLKNVRSCATNNPRQIQRIADTLYSMTAEETLRRIESSPDFNTQIGPMFGAWLKRNFKSLSTPQFQSAGKGIFVLEASEDEAMQFVREILKQDLEKRPDLVAKVNAQYIIGEAKWIGQPGGNQEKQVKEVLLFCKNQRRDIRRIGIVDGFPWALYNSNGNLINTKETVLIQESPYDTLSALLLKDYFQQFLV